MKRKRKNKRKRREKREKKITKKQKNSFSPSRCEPFFCKLATPNHPQVFIFETKKGLEWRENTILARKATVERFKTETNKTFVVHLEAFPLHRSSSNKLKRLENSSKNK